MNEKEKPMDSNLGEQIPATSTATATSTAIATAEASIVQNADEDVRTHLLVFVDCP